MSKSTGKYILRHAAGAYYLVDIAQSGEDYVKPLCINEVGATVFEFLSDGQDLSKAAEHIAAFYDMKPEEIMEDIRPFAKMLIEIGAVSDKTGIM